MTNELLSALVDVYVNLALLSGLAGGAVGALLVACVGSLVALAGKLPLSARERARRRFLRSSEGQRLTRGVIEARRALFRGLRSVR